MSVIIRPIEKDDKPVLAELIRSIFREHKIDCHGSVYTDASTDYLFELFQKQNSVYWVAEKDGRML